MRILRTVLPPGFGCRMLPGHSHATANLKNMSKKTTPDKKAATPAKRPAKPAAKRQASPQLAVAAKPVKAAKAKTAALATARAKRATRLTRDEIALRAYFIAEKRRHHALPGDESQDWIEAERELLAESKPAKKATPRKTGDK